jgi:hypothetical protein
MRSMLIGRFRVTLDTLYLKFHFYHNTATPAGQKKEKNRRTGMRRRRRERRGRRMKREERK